MEQCFERFTGVIGKPATHVCSSKLAFQLPCARLKPGEVGAVLVRARCRQVVQRRLSAHGKWPPSRNVPVMQPEMCRRCSFYVIRSLCRVYKCRSSRLPCSLTQPQTYRSFRFQKRYRRYAYKTAFISPALSSGNSEMLRSTLGTQSR